MRYCDNCGIAEMYTVLKYTPPVFIKPFHCMDRDWNRTSIGAHIMCIDEYECMRRFGMNMKPKPYYTSSNHILIECCGEKYSFGPDDKKERRACTGIEEEWAFTGDDLPEHRYICNKCGKVQIATKWKEYKNGLDRR